MIFKKKYYFGIVVIFICIMALFFTYYNNYFVSKDNNFIKYVKVKEILVKVDLASSFEEQTRGLSGRKELKENEGMLFIFQKPNKSYFWMKDMNFSIDIIWININKEIVSFKKNADPNLFPETYGPREDSLYVLEVPAGFVEKNNLKEGEKVDFLP